MPPLSIRCSPAEFAPDAKKTRLFGSRALRLSSTGRQAARTEFRNLPTSSLRRLLSPDSERAAESTCEEAAKRSAHQLQRIGEKFRSRRNCPISVQAACRRLSHRRLAEPARLQRFPRRRGIRECAGDRRRRRKFHHLRQPIAARPTAPGLPRYRPSPARWHVRLHHGHDGIAELRPDPVSNCSRSGSGRRRSGRSPSPSARRTSPGPATI